MTTVPQLVLSEQATAQNFNESWYLHGNPDVAAAVASGALRSGRKHFEVYGRVEGRSQRRLEVEQDEIHELRRRKLQRLQPLLRSDMQHSVESGRLDFLTSELRQSAGITSISHHSANNYDPRVTAMIERLGPEALLLDCGAGVRNIYYGTVVNYEIAPYDSTDVLGVGEALPFVDGAFDAVVSVAVLEHVRDPFLCAREISRVLRPGGELFCCMPFLQPYHGYPHHYFNATEQGLRLLFEDEIAIDEVSVGTSTHPIWTLQWILSSWCAGLQAPERKRFEAMTVRELLTDPVVAVEKPFCSTLPQAKQLELASATILLGRKR